MIVLTWDWKEGPNWDKLNKALMGWEGPIFFNEVDTDSDSYAVVVSHSELTKSEVKTVYQNYIQQ